MLLGVLGLAWVLGMLVSYRKRSFIWLLVLIGVLVVGVPVVLVLVVLRS